MCRCTVLRQPGRHGQLPPFPPSPNTHTHCRRLSTGSMVVGDLHVKRVRTLPPAANAILIVDRDRPLSFTVTPQRVKLVTRRRAEVAIVAHLIDVVQLPPRLRPSLLWAHLPSCLRGNPLKDDLSPPVRERVDHTRSSVIGRREECSALRVTCQGDAPTLGEIVLLDDHDRLLWDREQIAERVALSSEPPDQHRPNRVIGFARTSRSASRERAISFAEIRTFLWTATADAILGKLERLCTVINWTGH